MSSQNERESPEAAIVDLQAELRAGAGDGGPLWSLATADLNINLLRWNEGQGVPDHANLEVDVLIVALEGEGIVSVAGRKHQLSAGQACLIPKGTRRAIQAAGGSFAYLSCHRARRGLMPA